MRFSTSSNPAWLSLATIVSLVPFASSERLIESQSLNPCQANSSFTATLFNVIFTPDNNSLAFNILGVSSISGYVTAEIEFIAYGYTAVKETLNPCTSNLEGLCPMNTGQINIQSNIDIPSSVVKDLPSIAYGVPDLDGLVKVYIKNNVTGVSEACVEAQLSNGQTVDQKGVGWTTAVIAGLALLASAVTSGLGHSNTAAHVAANALSLFGFFQAQAIIGMTAVPLPPIVASWTQNFQWSLGIIRVDFLESVCTWYQRATGGTPSTLLSTLNTESVQVQKRSLEAGKRIMRAAHALSKRVDNTPATATAAKVVIVSGIKRVGFRAKIETTNIFLTGLIFFMIFVFLTAVCVMLFKGFCEIAVKAGWFKGDKFEDFRTGWKIVLKGILFRLVSHESRVSRPTTNSTTLGAHWLSANLHSMPLGIDTKGLRRRSRTCIILLRFDEHSPCLGFAEGLPNSQAISHHAQEPCLHPLLRPVCSQQMGVLICPVPCYRLLFYHAHLGLHPDQSFVHRFCPK